MIKKLHTIFLFLVLLPTIMSAQGLLEEIDSKRFRLGFSLGSNIMDLDVKHTEMIQDGKIYYADVKNLIPGYAVGLITNFRLHRYLHIRCTPTLLIGERKLQFRTLDVETKVMEDDKAVHLFSLPMDVPVYLRYSAEKYGNAKPYIQVGVGTYFDLGRDELTDVTLNLSDIYASGAIGCELHFKYFKLSPEIRFNAGTLNVLTPKRPTPENVSNLVYTNAISSILSRVIVFSLNIE